MLMAKNATTKISREPSKSLSGTKSIDINIPPGPTAHNVAKARAHKQVRRIGLLNGCGKYRPLKRLMTIPE